MGLWTRRGDEPLPLINELSDYNQCAVTPSTCRWSCGNQCAHEVPNATENLYFREVAGRMLSRRRLLGATAAAAGMLMLQTTPLGKLGGPATARAQGSRGLAFAALAGSTADDVAVPAGYKYETILRWGDPLFRDAVGFDPAAQTAALQARRFGYNCDFIGYSQMPGHPGEGGLLCVNHEYTNPELMFPGYDSANPTKEQVDTELAAHGASVVYVRKNSAGAWRYVIDAAVNRRITATTPMMLTGPAAGHALLRTSADPSGTSVLGMLNNCAGGMTPWGTYLTAEENFNQYFANNSKVSDAATKAAHTRYGLTANATERKWERFYDRFDLAKEPNEAFRFGWIVEIDPELPNSMPKKRTALGRTKHEGAETSLAPNGQVVLYMGDDERFDYVYKFVTAGKYNPNNRMANLDLLDSGTLYVARYNDDGSGTWIALVQGQNGLTAANGFPTQGDILIKTRQAADRVGATKMDRPEDIERNPVTGKVYGLFTNNTNRGTGTNPKPNASNPRAANRFGHIIEMTEKGNDPTSTSFTWDIFMLCGDPSAADTYFAGFDKSQVTNISCPDNCAFDKQGNLWIATDGQPGTIGINDSIYAVATEGPERGKLKRFMSGVPGGEVCGPYFTPANTTLFAAIQHPGEGGDYAEPSGTIWPLGGTVSRPSVIAMRKEDGGVIGS